MRTALALILSLYTTNLDRTKLPELKANHTQIDPEEDITYMLSSGMLVRVSTVFDGATQVDGRSIDEKTYRDLMIGHIPKSTLRLIYESGRPCIYGIFFGEGFGKTSGDFLYFSRTGSWMLGADTARAFPLKNGMCK